jgi:hypothetical protein
MKASWKHLPLAKDLSILHKLFHPSRPFLGFNLLQKQSGLGTKKSSKSLVVIYASPKINLKIII